MLRSIQAEQLRVIRSSDWALDRSIAALGATVSAGAVVHRCSARGFTAQATVCAQLPGAATQFITPAAQGATSMTLPRSAVQGRQRSRMRFGSGSPVALDTGFKRAGRVGISGASAVSALRVSTGRRFGVEVDGALETSGQTQT
ncbi:MAG: hypothetical protein RL227_110 [Pseudomonadota bacterium]